MRIKKNIFISLIIILNIIIITLTLKIFSSDSDSTKAYTPPIGSGQNLSQFLLTPRLLIANKIVPDIDAMGNYSTNPSYTGVRNVTVDPSHMGEYFSNYIVSRSGGMLSTPTFDSNGNVQLLTGTESTWAGGFTVGDDFVNFDFSSSFHLNVTVNDYWDPSINSYYSGGGDGIDIMFAQQTTLNDMFQNINIAPTKSLHFIIGPNWGNLDNFPSPYSYPDSYWYAFSTLGANVYAKLSDQFSGGLANYIIGGPGNVYSTNIPASSNNGNVTYTLDVQYNAPSTTITAYLRTGDDPNGNGPVIYTWNYQVGTSNVNSDPIAVGMPTIFSVFATEGSSRGSVHSRANYYNYTRSVVNLNLTSSVTNGDSNTQTTFNTFAPSQSGIVAKPNSNIMFYQGSAPYNPPNSTGQNTYDSMYQVPNVPGYTLNPINQSISLSGGATTTYNDNLTFTADNQNVIVHYVDSKGNAIQSPTTLTGLSDSAIDYSSINKSINNYILTNDGTSGTVYYDHDDNNDQNVYLVYSQVEQVAKIVTNTNDANGNPIYVPNPVNVTAQGPSGSQILNSDNTNVFGISDFVSSKGSNNSLYRPGYTYTVTDPSGNVYSNNSTLQSDQNALLQALQANSQFDQTQFSSGTDPNPQIFTVTYTGMQLQVNYELRSTKGKSLAVLNNQLDPTIGSNTAQYFGSSGSNITNMSKDQLTAYLKGLFPSITNSFDANGTIIYKSSDSTISPVDQFYNINNSSFTSDESSLTGINIPQYFSIPDFNVNNYGSVPGIITIQFYVKLNGRDTLRAVPNFDFGMNNLNTKNNFNLANNVTNNNTGANLNLDYTNDFSSSPTGDPISSYLQTNNSTTPIKRDLVLTNASGNTKNTWQVECQLGNFITNNNETINNEKISLTLGSTNINGINDFGVSGSSMYTSGGTPTVSQPTLISGGSAANVLSSNNSDNAVGSWRLDFNNNTSASLFVPKDALNQLTIPSSNLNLTTTLTWTLISNTPSS